MRKLNEFVTWSLSFNAEFMSVTNLECCSVHPDYAEPLSRFFQRLAAAGVDRFFHPHPFTAEEAMIRSNYYGRDVYYLLVEDSKIIGYGMLRGWDEGFQTPSLGIVIDPSAQGRGLGRYLMSVLHATARERGASQVRLKVYPENKSAVKLYKSLGYEFLDEQDGQLIGILKLANG